MKIIKTLIIIPLAFIAIIINCYGQNSLTVFDYDQSNYPNIRALFYAFDENSGIIKSLSAGDFNISDNGVSVPAANVECPGTNEEHANSVVIAFDLALNNYEGGTTNFKAAQLLGKELIERLDLDTSECAVTSFDYISYLNQEFTSDPDMLFRAIDSLPSARGSYFDKGLLSLPAGAIPVAEKGDDEKSIILITDGIGAVNVDSVVAQAAKSNVRLFTIGLGNELPDGLKSVSEQSGGRWVENIQPQQDMSSTAAILRAFMQGSQPCELTWNSPLDCDDEHFVEIEIPSRSVSSTFTYSVPEGNKPYIEARPSNIAFKAILHPATEVRSVFITARYADIHIDSMKVTDTSNKFSIVSGTELEDYTLKKDAQHEVKVKFTPVEGDSALIFSKLIIYSNACFGEEIRMTAGFPNRPPRNKTIEIVSPNGGETLFAGDTAAVKWDGLLERDVILLEYTTDNGQSWDTLAKDVNGLKYNWKVPDEYSDSCYVRAVQLWPNNVGKTMDLRHYRAVNSAFFNSDQNLVVTSCKDKMGRLWNANNGKELVRYKGHTDEVLWAEFSPDDQLVVTASSDSTAKIWKRETGELLYTLSGHEGEVRSACFSPDGEKVLTTSADRTAILWDAETGEQIKVLLSSDKPLYFACFDPAGEKAVISGVGKYVKVLKVEDSEVVSEFDTELDFNIMSHVNYSPDGSRLAASSQIGPTIIWDVTTEQKILEVTHFDSLGNPSPILFSSFDQTGDTLLTAGFDNKIRMWHVHQNTSEPILTFEEHTSSVKSAVFNFDGMRVLTASSDSTAKIWNRAQRDLQTDRSDDRFSIAKAEAIAFNVDFDKVLMGEVVDTLVSVFAVNTTKYPFMVRNIEIQSDDTGDFSILGDNEPYVLQPGDTSSIELRFEPQLVGTRNARIVITYPNGTAEAELTGEGIYPDLLATNKYIYFREIELGDFKDSVVSAIVQNKSGTALQVTEINILGPDTEHFDIISGGQGFTLAPNDSHEMTLRFTPEKLGRLNSQLQFLHTGKEKDTRVFLFGEGVPMVVDTATIAIDTLFKAYPGDEIQMPIYIKDISSRGIPPNVTGFNAALRFNSTLLEPLQPLDVENDEIVGTERIITMNLPLDEDNDGILTTINFKVGLGNDTTSPIILENIAPIGSGKMIIYRELGTFNLLGVCHEGGARLFDSEGRISLMHNYPNPFEESTTIEFETAEKGITKLYITDMMGNTVRTIVNEKLEPGQHRISIDSRGLPSGVYFYNLKTPTVVITRRMHIER